MSENNCDPILNIQIPDLSIDQINDLIELGKNRSITIQDIIAITSDQQEETPSRSPISSATSFSPQSTSNSRPSQTQRGGVGPSLGNQQSSQSKECRPPQKGRGAWSIPFTSHGKVQGVPIEPRELNCDCIGN